MIAFLAPRGAPDFTGQVLVADGHTASEEGKGLQPADNTQEGGERSPTAFLTHAMR